MKNKESKYYKCACHSHALEVDTSFREEEGEVWFSIWERGRASGKLSWKEKIRWCLRIIKTGNPWGDSVALNEEQIKELVEQLNENK